ncbi:MAG: HypC/HybG/HupF family hydrogenase formation chaperone [Gracilimonas sp.]
MCLSIPGKITAIYDDTASISVGGSEVEASLQLLDDVKVGEYVLVHSGFALQRISDEEAQNMLEVIRAMDDMAESEHEQELDKNSKT